MPKKFQDDFTALAFANFYNFERSKTFAQEVLKELKTQYDEHGFPLRRMVRIHREDGTSYEIEINSGVPNEPPGGM